MRSLTEFPSVPSTLDCDGIERAWSTPGQANDPAAYAIEDQWRMSRARNYFAWQGRMVRPELGQRVVEVGCGIGNFTEMLLDRAAVCAVDVEPRSVKQLLTRYAGRRNLSAIACDVQSEQFSQLSDFGADSCVCLNVLEHTADDLGVLGRMASILPRKGVIVLLVPAFPSLYGPIDRNLGHHRRYSRASLVHLVAAAGLRTRKLRYVNAAGFLGWWTNAHLFRREVQSAVQIEFFDRYVVPLSSWIEERRAPPFGQSLLMVLEKS